MFMLTRLDWLGIEEGAMTIPTQVAELKIETIDTADTIDLTKDARHSWTGSRFHIVTM